MRIVSTDLLSAPITALEVFSDYVLFGEASYLHIHELTSGETHCKVCVLDRHVIHGIRKDINGEKGLCAVFGQKAIRVIHLEPRETISVTPLCDGYEFPDWILDVGFLSREGSPDACLGVVLAHNSVALWDWRLVAPVRHVHCAENCILYSAKLVGCSWEGLLIAAGTVFNQVVLWRATDHQDDTGRVGVTTRLDGHQGVIFNLSYHKRRRLLCTVSDDRSVRLWHLNSEDTPAERSGTSLAVLYGHTARVWDVKILDEVIVSVGEDAACCVWNTAGDVIHRFTGHKGRSIWSLAVHDDQKRIITGGGDGSIRVWSIDVKQEQGITTEELDVEVDGRTIFHAAREQASISGESRIEPSTIPAGRQDFTPRQLAVLNTGEILVMTTNGCLFLYGLRTKRWRLLSYDVDYQSYSLLNVSPSHKMAALGNAHGRVKILQLDSGSTLGEASLFSGKVFSMCWLEDDSLFVSGPAGVVIRWRLTDRPPDGRYSTNSMSLRFTLPEASQRWATAIALVPSEEGSLVCGDRRGSLLLYRRLHESSSDEQPALPTHILPGIHGKAGVTHLCHHAGFIYSTGRDGTYRQYRLQGTGLYLMNTYKVYKGFTWIENISFTMSDDVLVSGFHSSAFIVWSQRSSEKLIQIDCGGGHRAWGFTSVRTSDTSAVRNEECSSPHEQPPVDCCSRGLGPRDGRTDPPSLDGDRVLENKPTPSNSDRASSGLLAVFACVKARKVILCTAPGDKLRQRTILKGSFHGRKVSCIKHLAEVSLPKGDCSIFATGSEDNAINISVAIFPHDAPPTLHVLHRLDVHISSVRCLATCPSVPQGPGAYDTGTCPTRRLLLFSVGGRRAVQCWGITLPYDCPVQQKADTWLKSTCTVEHLASHGNTDNVKQRRWQRKHGLVADPETRFMSLRVWSAGQLGHESGGKYLLAVVGSDGCIRLFLFNEGAKSLLPVLTTAWHTGCLLTTASILAPAPPADGAGTPLLITAGTDGTIAAWELVNPLTDNPGLGEEMDSPRHQYVGNTLAPTETWEKDTEQREDGLGRNSVCSNDTGEPHTGNHALRLLLSVQTHQSGVNALSVTKIKDEEYLLASGGDDNSIHLSILSVTRDDSPASPVSSVCVKHSHSVASAHAAQVTGLCFIDGSTLVSSSIDQRLNVWRTRIKPHDNPVIQVELVASKFTLIADTSSMDCWLTRSGGYCLAVCGQGVQFLRLEDCQPDITDGS